MYVENAELSLETAQNLLKLENNMYKPYLWIIVTSYYSMYYIANAVLLQNGYVKEDALDLISTKTDTLLISLDYEREKRSKFLV